MGEQSWATFGDQVEVGPKEGPFRASSSPSCQFLHRCPLQSLSCLQSHSMTYDDMWACPQEGNLRMRTDSRPALRVLYSQQEGAHPVRAHCAHTGSGVVVPPFWLVSESLIP